MASFYTFNAELVLHSVICQCSKLGVTESAVMETLVMSGLFDELWMGGFLTFCELSVCPTMRYIISVTLAITGLPVCGLYTSIELCRRTRVTYFMDCEYTISIHLAICPSTQRSVTESACHWLWTYYSDHTHYGFISLVMLVDFIRIYFLNCRTQPINIRTRRHSIITIKHFDQKFTNRMRFSVTNPIKTILI